jgi:Zn-dependent alcohol dehydrogenase
VRGPGGIGRPDPAGPADVAGGPDRLRGSYYGSGDPAADLAELARLAADGLLDLAVGISDLTDLDGIEAAFDRLRRGDGAARTVVILDPALAGAAPGR